MSKLKASVFIIPIITFLIIGILYFWWRYSTSPVNSKDTQAHTFLITKGQNVAKIGNNLKKEGLVRSDLVFRIYVKLTGRDKVIQAGQYKFAPNLTLEQVILTLVRGPQALWITYPEGLRHEEIAVRTIKALELTGSEATKYYNEFANLAESQEGFLFPDTYLFPKEASAGAIVRKMTETFESKFTDQMETDMKAKGLTKDEVVILASIIERETITDEERPIVAGILYNRLNIDMPLQVDATLQYIVGCKTAKVKQLPSQDCGWWGSPNIATKKADSPYNTYLNTGLPPAPIANPGLTSIKAAIYPQKTDYIFYLHGKDGKIRYGKTSQDHQENIQKYL